MNMVPPIKIREPMKLIKSRKGTTISKSNKTPEVKKELTPINIEPKNTRANSLFEISLLRKKVNIIKYGTRVQTNTIIENRKIGTPMNSKIITKIQGIRPPK